MSEIRYCSKNGKYKVSVSIVIKAFQPSYLYILYPKTLRRVAVDSHYRSKQDTLGMIGPLLEISGGSEKKERGTS